LERLRTLVERKPLLEHGALVEGKALLEHGAPVDLKTLALEEPLVEGQAWRSSRLPSREREVGSQARYAQARAVRHLQAEGIPGNVETLRVDRAEHRQARGLGPQLGGGRVVLLPSRGQGKPYRKSR